MDNGTLLLASLEPCWLWWLILSALAFILGALLGCLLCSNRKRLRELEEENSGLKARVTNWEKDYSSLKYQQEEAQKDLTTLRRKLNSCEADKTVLSTKLEKLKTQSEGSDAITENSPTVLGATGSETTERSGESDYAQLFQDSDLKIIEGIGPKIEKTLKEAGIINWALLAEANEAKISELINKSGTNKGVRHLNSWPEQARLAHQGKWDELVEYQRFLNAGASSSGTTDMPSKLEKMAMKVAGFSSDPEDLTVIEGVGPKIAGLLKEADIHSWQDLSQTAVDRLKQILKDGGSQFNRNKPDTWPQQATLAAAGKWGELQTLQDRLQGGIDEG